MILSPSYFFNFPLFAHSILFSKITYVWEALEHLPAYLHTIPLGVHAGDISPQAYLINPELISIGKGSRVEPGAFIQGPCVIGERCTVRHGAYIRGDVLTGDDCVIGHDTEVKASIFFNRAHAAHFAYVGDSILGHGVNLGAGTKCANFRLDQGLIHIHFQKNRIETGRRKLGAIIGDDSQIGCNTVLNPGTLIGQNVQCYPCLNAGGFIPSKSKIVPSVMPIIVTKETTDETI
jgi:UDP-N-acetylglucosamine diphosphorylase / glucose-1-phosphate thymidylyltransferase / UDP-N-acetylgalactosamine diphosphorylase / glucosamine-1-phosphate N-acetyltransferase / galactosamine-1-phosphate N-acetyltransferase